MNVSRDLFLLSAVAFQHGDFDKAASLFVSSLSSADAQEFLDQVDQMAGDTPLIDPASESSTKSNLRSIVQIIKASMQSTHSALASEDLDLEDEDDGESDEDDSSDSEDDPSEEDGDEDSDLESDDVDPDSPGERIIPSALSSVTSAVKVKQ